MKVVTIALPGDKSISHRALMFSCLAEGESSVRGLLAGADVQSTAAVLRALGCEIPRFDERGDEIRIHGVGLRGLKQPSAKLDCGNSGTTARLMLGVLSAQKLTAVLDGDESLRSRPMRRVTEPLARMGARFRELQQPDRVPIEVHGGGLQPVQHVNAKSSAQVKSAVLLAALCSGVSASIDEPTLSRDHTERMLASMGAAVTVLAEDSVTIDLAPVDRLHALTIAVPRDFSSAAFFLALGALLPDTELRMSGVGVNRTRTGLLNVLERMGAGIEMADVEDRGGEPVAQLITRPANLHATTVEPHEIPALIDEVPIIAALAAHAEGETVIRGAGELRLKETDRLAAIAQNLRALGVEASDDGDDLHIAGTQRPLKGSVRSFGDHRIAMAFGVLGALPDHSIAVDDTDCVAISFPEFWNTLSAIRK